MKITAVEILQQPAESPLPRDYQWLLIHTDAGITGLGELNRRPHQLVPIIQGWADELLLGRDPRQIERIWETLYSYSTPYGNTGAARRALSAIDVALWDILGKSLDAPVWRLLGGTCRERVPVYRTGVGVGRDRAETAELVAGLMEAGWRAIKSNVFTASPEHHDPSRQRLWRQASLAQVRRGQEVMDWIRDAAGDALEVGIDCHPLWELHGALRVVRAMEPYDVMFFECPLFEDNVRTWQALARQVRVPLMCGEYNQSRFQLRPFIEEGVVSIVNPDLAWVGGISEVRRIGTLARIHGVSVALHDSGPVTTYARCHVMAHLANAFYQELSNATLTMWDAVAESLPMESSSLPLPNGPGLGVELAPWLLKAAVRLRVGAD